MDDATEGAWRAVLPAVAAGAVLWLAGSALAGWREAWDGPAYLWLVYPGSLVAAGMLARRHPRYAARIAFAVFGGQLLVLFLSNPGGSLLPVGVILFGVLALPAVAVAKWAARRPSS